MPTESGSPVAITLQSLDMTGIVMFPTETVNGNIIVDPSYGVALRCSYASTSRCGHEGENTTACVKSRTPGAVLRGRVCGRRGKCRRWAHVEIPGAPTTAGCLLGRGTASHRRRVPVTRCSRPCRVRAVRTNGKAPSFDLSFCHR